MRCGADGLALGQVPRLTLALELEPVAHSSVVGSLVAGVLGGTTGKSQNCQ